MPDLGIRLQLLIGPTIPKPAPYEVVESLIDIEIQHQDRDRSGFQITFSIGKNLKKSFKDYGLLLDGILDPPNRVIFMINLGVQPYILMDGIITHHQVIPSSQPGESRLIVTGEDISLKLDLEEKSETYENQSDSMIVTRLLNNYRVHGLIPKVTTTTYNPRVQDKIRSQQKTDLTFIQSLAEDNGFIFYIKPTKIPTQNIAYWGEEEEQMEPTQPALTMNMGPYTNVDVPMTFAFDALEAIKPQLEIVNPSTGAQIPVAVPTSSSQRLASNVAKTLRQTVLRNTDKLDQIPAKRLAESVASRSQKNAVIASGEVDTLRYGHILQVRRLVGVRGVGNTYDGNYYVKQVTHRIKRGEYKQSFTLIREGRGTTTQIVKV
jgi:hypothetical protein